LSNLTETAECPIQPTAFAIAFPAGRVHIEAGYRPRYPQESPLYAAVAGRLETFLARQRQRDRDVPRFVERELRSFLECGILAYGFVRVHRDF
jgi:hypothetical protein